MGNYFSGNRRPDRRVCVEEVPTLDIHTLTRAGRLRPGKPFGWHWPRTRSGIPAASVGICAGRTDGLDDLIETPDGCANFLHIGFRCGDTLVRRVIPVVWQACYYGGHRPYFLCPWCSKNRTNLFLIHGYFICRQCGDMCYGSQLEHRADRQQRRAIKLRRRLGAGPGVRDFIDRPRGMHRTRFYRMLDQIEGLEAAALAMALGRERRLI
jgi:hypothetical protein